jgi:sugar phosphate isomerase/epimerase
MFLYPARKKHMKYSVTTVMLPELDVLETCTLLKELGFDGVEWRVRYTTREARDKGYGFWADHKSDLSPDNLQDRAKEVLEISQDHGLEIAAIASDVRAGDLETLKKLADGVSLLGKVPIKVAPPNWYFRQAKYEDLFQETVSAYERSLAILAPYGLRALVETHNNTIVVSASLAFRLVSNFSAEKIGVIYDLNNMASDGFETFRLGLELLGGYLQHCHLAGKRPMLRSREEDGTVRWEFETCDLADGILSVRQFLSDLNAVSYDRFISIEDFRPGDPRAVLEAQIRYLRNLEKSL